eukprot:TRINITY_DN8773_c0_g2_i2.p1 TRINITY_DN8773_c0_g2~~TRINITY_DN8773_c0_g2_i2.p1  ORF type:complete len:627 (+),score=101.54 TRINITY_DN8773_c0_g2_i2:53-1933(+)
MVNCHARAMSVRRAAIATVTLLSAWQQAHGNQDACPNGYYRSSTIVFGCHGGQGTSDLHVAPGALSPGVKLPAGVQGFHVSASSAQAPVALELYDPLNRMMVVSEHHGLLNSTTRAGTYKDMGIVYSGGADVQGGNSSLYLLGTLPCEMDLSFRNLGNESSATVTLIYQFTGVTPCPSPCTGCSTYDEAAAERAVLVWSRWASSKFPNATEAWDKLAVPHVRGADVPWSLWPAVWAAFLGGPSTLAGESWQPAFHYFDSDGNGRVSWPEFLAGYQLSEEPQQRNDAGSQQHQNSDLPGGIGSLWAAVLGIVLVLLLSGLACYCCRTRSEPKMARVVSNLSRQEPQDAEVGKPTQHPRSLEGSSAPLQNGKDIRTRDLNLGDQGLQTAGADPEGLWLFPQLSRTWHLDFGLWPGRQDSFRYGPLPLNEDSSQGLLPPQGQHSPLAASMPAAFSGSFAPGSLSVPVANGSVSLTPPNTSSFYQAHSGRQHSFHAPSDQLSGSFHQLGGAAQQEAARVEAMRVANAMGTRSESFSSSAVASVPSSIAAPAEQGAPSAKSMAFFSSKDWDRATQHLRKKPEAQSVPVSVEVGVPIEVVGSGHRDTVEALDVVAYSVIRGHGQTSFTQGPS